MTLPLIGDILLGLSLLLLFLILCDMIAEGMAMWERRKFWREYSKKIDCDRWLK